MKLSRITMKKITSFIATAGLQLLPILTLAQGSGITQPVPLPNTQGFGVQGFIGVFNTLINWLFTLLLILAVVFILIAAFLYITGGGNEEKIKKAHNYLKFAAIGIAVALLAQGVRFLISQLVGVPVGV